MKQNIKMFYGAVLIIVLLFQFGCNVRQPLVEKDNKPVLTEFILPQTLYYQNPGYVNVSVKVTDPQGQEDIQLVSIQIMPENNETIVYMDTLFDDGKNGDLVYNDGVYTGIIDGPLLGNSTGSFTCSVYAVDLNGNSSEMGPLSFEAVDDLGSMKPVISEALHSDTLNVEDLEDFEITLQVTDENGAADVDSIWFDLYPPYGTEVVYHGRLYDDGAMRDVSAGDSVFSYSGSMEGALIGLGDYLIRFQAADQAGLKSNIIVNHLFMNLEDGPPILSQLSAPDSVSRIEGAPFVISVKAQDPMGLSDIKRVFFNVTVPTGEPAAGNPFSMYDDGLDSDLTAGDGIYSLTVTIDINNNNGIYRFDFTAEDFAGSFSDTLTHYITVIN